MEALAGLIGLNLFLLCVLLWMVVRRSRSEGVAPLTQQVSELRTTLQSVASTQADLPRVLAEARAGQAADFTQNLASFANMVSGQIDAGQERVGQRLADAGDLISDVRERLGQLSVSARRIEELGAGVNEVHELLRVPKLRGALGEVWLEEMLQQIVPADMYATQFAFPTGERVDAIVKLGGRVLCIDAKFPLEACQRMLAANGDQGETERHRRAFYRSVRGRIDEISNKYVKPNDGTFEFALMYVPAERVYHEALSGNADDLMSYAMEKRVILVSPNTLYAYLSSILHGLRGFHVQQNARMIADLISGLQLRFVQLGKIQDTLGRHLENASKQQSEAVRLVQGLESQLASLPGMGAGPNRPSRPFVGPVRPS